MADEKFKWYVMRAVSGKEAKVKEYIDAEIKNGQLGGFVAQVLIPTEKVYQMQGSKRVVKERNYLPGYVLVEAHLVGEIAHILRSTPNCLGFLGGTDNPEPLRTSEMNRILGKADDLDTEPAEMVVPYEVNDSVKVKDCVRYGVRSFTTTDTWFYASREGIIDSVTQIYFLSFNIINKYNHNGKRNCWTNQAPN